MRYKIKTLREEAGLSCEELAQKCGVCRATIWALETNKRVTTTTKTLLKLAKALNTTVDALFFAE